MFYQNIDEDSAGNSVTFLFLFRSNYPVTKVENITNEINSLCKWIITERKIHPWSLRHWFKKFVFIHPFKDGNGRGQTLMNTA